MSLATKYNPKEVEDKWYAYWMEKKLFSSKPNPDKEPYTIVIPPPNVTGVLHMGHMMNNTIQDVLIRKARMQGKEACWVPGTDHASIATEAKVVAMLKEKGINKKDISREEFLKYAFEWKEKYGGIILEQLKKLGASCDWDRTRFTMEDDMSAAVIEVFVDLYNKGKIYRGIRMVNWDPQGKTAVSDDEVIYKEVNSKLYYIKYQIDGEDNFLTIATTRPETLLGDTALCINPNDERYKHLKGKNAIVPLVNRAVPIIEDEYVNMEFGTGCLKVTPAHDINDYELGQKHRLDSIDIFNDDGTINEKGGLYIGEDRFVVRKKIVKELDEKSLLEKAEDYKNNVGFSERTDAVIEPKLSMQWFVTMKDITKPAFENVMNDNIQLYPPKFKNMYRSWMENVKDWCISRQLWWGQRIPAFYLPDGTFVVAETPEKALELAKAQSEEHSLTINDLRQDEDVLDTWFSSWLWPISVFNGFKDPENEDIKYYYPTNDLVTAPEILFFWVARMIIAGYEYRGEKPFKNVYLTGIVRDKLGRKMSKSLGNSPDPIELIQQYGADGVRTGMLFSSPAGNDLPFDEKLCEQGRNFANKIWNAFRLIKGWQVSDKVDAGINKSAIAWFNNRINQAQEEIEDFYTKFRISDALLSTYKLIWDDFCSWYLEMIKPGFEEPIDRTTYEATIEIFEKLMKILHPFMPFITEELWHEIRDRKEEDCIIIATWPELVSYDENLLNSASLVFEIISSIRNTRNEKQISPKTELSLFVKSNKKEIYEQFENIIMKLANISEITFTDEKPKGAIGFVVKTEELFIPSAGEIDVEKERQNLLKELEYTRGFLQSVQKKLSNEKFVKGAPAQVLDNERKKQTDGEAKIQVLEEGLAALDGK
ncbi:MAG: valine--tRNA ligase [Bacteroidota bacterium]|nr:valine--tRNA ligase [Bacteroidota bacterium]